MEEVVEEEGEEMVGEVVAGAGGGDLEDDAGLTAEVESDSVAW